MLRCLIVDDNELFLDAASDLLEREGVAVVGLASTGAEALQRVEQLRPDIVLLDIELGTESGFDLARHLDQQAGEGPPRTILISTHAQLDYEDLIAMSPAIGFVSKSDLSAKAILQLLDGQA